MAKVNQRVQRAKTTIAALPPPPPPVPPAQLPGNPGNAQTPASGPGASSGPLEIDKPHFERIRSMPGYAHWAACATKFSYAESQGAIDTLATLSDAKSGQFIAGPGGIVPAGARLVFNSSVVYVINGTTRPEQARMYQRSGGMVEMAFSNSGIVPASQVGVASGSPYWAGVYYEPFVRCAPWIDLIAEDMITTHKGKKVYLIGHSLGGAICEVIANLASYKADFLIRSILPSVSGGPTTQPRWTHVEWENLAGGFTMGVPNVVDWRGPYKKWYPDHTFQHSINTNTNVGVQWSRLTSRITTFNHPGDPVPSVPSTFSGVPWIYWAAGATSGSLRPSRNTRQIRSLGGWTAEEHLRTYPEERSLPTSIADVKSRALLYHPSNSYEKLFRAILSQYAGTPYDWLNMSTLSSQAAYNGTDDSIDL